MSKQKIDGTGKRRLIDDTLIELMGVIGEQRDAILAERPVPTVVQLKKRMEEKFGQGIPDAPFQKILARCKLELPGAAGTRIRGEFAVEKCTGILFEFLLDTCRQLNLSVAPQVFEAQAELKAELAAGKVLKPTQRRCQRIVCRLGLHICAQTGVKPLEQAVRMMAALDGRSRGEDNPQPPAPVVQPSPALPQSSLPAAAPPAPQPAPSIPRQPLLGPSSGSSPRAG